MVVIFPSAGVVVGFHDTAVATAAGQVAATTVLFFTSTPEANEGPPARIHCLARAKV
jgi:hypothetical protein